MAGPHEEERLRSAVLTGKGSDKGEASSAPGGPWGDRLGLLALIALAAFARFDGSRMLLVPFGIDRTEFISPGDRQLLSLTAVAAAVGTARRRCPWHHAPVPLPLLYPW